LCLRYIYMHKYLRDVGSEGNTHSKYEWEIYSIEQQQEIVPLN